jgi:hypothetical protein
MFLSRDATIPTLEDGRIACMVFGMQQVEGMDNEDSMEVTSAGTYQAIDDIA